MRYTKITYPDLNNGIGCRVTLWLSGCDLHCPGCHNSELWDPLRGKEFTEETYQTIKEILSLPYIDGITVSGGEPTLWFFNPEGPITLESFLERIKTEFPNKNIWLYTGRTIDDIPKKALEYIDTVVDGPYKEDLRDITLPFRGSSNQRIINVVH